MLFSETKILYGIFKNYGKNQTLQLPEKKILTTRKQFYNKSKCANSIIKNYIMRKKLYNFGERFRQHFIQ